MQNGPFKNKKTLYLLKHNCTHHFNVETVEGRINLLLTNDDLDCESNFGK